MLLTVNVAQRHIDDGTIDCTACPIALAIMDADSHIKKAWVGEEGIDIELHDGDCMSAHTPDDAARFIDAFDGEMVVEPFALDLDFH